MRFLLKILIILFFFSVCIPILKGSHDTFLVSDFYKVESYCKELLNDLTVIKFDNSLTISWIQQSRYITDQVMALQEAICTLVENEEEARIYLTEDFAYLFELFSQVEMGFWRWYKNDASKAHKAVTICLQKILQESKKNLERLALYNKEVIANGYFY